MTSSSTAPTKALNEYVNTYLSALYLDVHQRSPLHLRANPPRASAVHTTSTLAHRAEALTRRTLPILTYRRRGLGSFSPNSRREPSFIHLASSFPDIADIVPGTRQANRRRLWTISSPFAKKSSGLAEARTANRSAIFPPKSHVPALLNSSPPRPTSSSARYQSSARTSSAYPTFSLPTPS